MLKANSRLAAQTELLPDFCAAPVAHITPRNFNSPQSAPVLNVDARNAHLLALEEVSGAEDGVGVNTYQPLIGFTCNDVHQRKKADFF